MPVDHGERNRRWSKLDIVHVPIGYAAGNLGKPLLDERAMFCLLQGDDEMGFMEVSQHARHRCTQFSIGHDGLRLECFQRKSGHRADVIGRSLLGRPAGECAPRQAFALGEMVEKLFRISASVVIAGAEEQDLFHRRTLEAQISRRYTSAIAFASASRLNFSSTRARACCPIVAASAGSRISGSSAAASASASPGGVSTPVTPSSTTNSAAPARAATNALPAAIASISVRPKPSLREVKAYIV